MKSITIESKTFGRNYILLDDSDYDLINQWTWHIKKDHNVLYARRNYWINVDGVKKCKSVLLHRILLNENDPKVLIDHKDHNGLNNQRINLRRCSTCENLRNKKSELGSSSRFLGVTYRKESNTWEASIKDVRVGKRKYIGRFQTEQQAAAAYNLYAETIFGEFANPNVIS